MFLYCPDSSSPLEPMEYVRFDKNYGVTSFVRAPCEFPKGVKITDSCNGLLLCLFGKSFGDPETKLYVCNPTTKDVARVPNLGNVALRTHFILAFDASTPKTYRLVCLQSVDDLQRIDVYESETSSWRHSAIVPNDVDERMGGVFCNSAVHWLALQDGNSDPLALYSFDLDQDSFKRTEVHPAIRHGESETLYFGTCQGHLSVLKLVVEFNTLSFKFYEMEHDFSCLPIKYSISHHDLAHNLFTCQFSTALDIFLGKEGQLFIVVSAAEDVYTYDARDPYSVPIQTNFSGNFLGFMVHHNYIESLAPV